MRKGFTMIELIFVIVILGILAAVAIPRLTATRDDAQIARAVSDVATAVQDIGAFYTARGNFGTAGAMTNVQFVSNAVDLNAGNTAVYQVNNANCINFTTTAAGAADGNLTVTNIAGATGVCADVQTIIGQRDLNGTHQFGGQGVTW